MFERDWGSETCLGSHRPATPGMGSTSSRNRGHPTTQGPNAKVVPGRDCVACRIPVQATLGDTRVNCDGLLAPAPNSDTPLAIVIVGLL